MNTILDPVWPWSRLWDVLLQVPGPIRGLGVLAVLLATVLPVLLFPVRGKPTGACHGRR